MEKENFKVKETYMTEEQREEFLAKLKECQTGYGTDFETAHRVADGVLYDVLVALGYEDIADAWDEVCKWYC
jgi:hypothetical protein